MLARRRVAAAAGPQRWRQRGREQERTKALGGWRAGSGSDAVNGSKAGLKGFCRRLGRGDGTGRVTRNDVTA